MDTRPFVRRKQFADRKLVLFLVSAALVSSTIVAAASAWAPGVPENLRGPLRIASVTHAPDQPQPGQPIAVTVQVAGEIVGTTTVRIQYAAYFAVVASGGGAMTPVGSRTYTEVLPSFPDGTEVWYVVGVSVPGRDPILSDSVAVDVGTVLRGGESGLRVVDVRHTPEQPWFGEPITVEAVVSSRAAVAEVDIAYMSFCREATIPIDPPMVPAAPTVYTFTIEPDGPCARSPGSVLLYRVLAVDVTGNTAVSDVVAVPIR